MPREVNEDIATKDGLHPGQGSDFSRVKKIRAPEGHSSRDFRRELPPSWDLLKVLLAQRGRERPKGFFPVQDTGVILGITEAPESSSFRSVADRQQQVADVVLKDPDVESLSSFIGVDGTNMTPNVGRIQINLKPRDQRSATASDIIRRLQPHVSQIAGMVLYMQAVQDITVESRVSRTQ